MNYTTIEPPARYVHPPTVPVIEHVLEYGPLQFWCSMFPGPNHLQVFKDKTRHFNGCSAFLPIDGEKTCFVWYLPGDTAARRHELAHCNGWPGNHPTK